MYIHSYKPKIYAKKRRFSFKKILATILFAMFGASIIWLFLTVEPAEAAYMPPRETIIIYDIEATLMPSYKATVTAYSKIETCPGRKCITASSKEAKIGMAACPRNLPFGTRIFIDGDTYYCEDRTHVRFDGRFDLFMGNDYNSYIKALAHGKQYKKVTIVE